MRAMRWSRFLIRTISSKTKHRFPNRTGSGRFTHVQPTEIMETIKTDTRSIETMLKAEASLGKSLLEALIQEIKLLPKPWQKLSRYDQDEVIGRLRSAVDEHVREAVLFVAADQRATAEATLKKVVFKDGITAEFTLSKTCPTRHELADAEGQLCLIVVADPGKYLGDMDGVKGEDDQRGMNLGHEYEPNSDGKGMGQ